MKHKTNEGWVCILHRCAKHYDVPAQNTNEAGGSECGGCIAAERDNWKAQAERAAFARSLALGARDSLAAQLDEAVNTARFNGAERDALIAAVREMIQAEQHSIVEDSHAAAMRHRDAVTKVRALALGVKL